MLQALLMRSGSSAIPDVGTSPLRHVFETRKLEHKEGELWLEFGVASGDTINFISQFTERHVFGFDSFEGLPEKWRDGFDKGAFSSGGSMPPVNANVRLVKGWFDTTLPVFLTARPDDRVSFVHIDCDLYSSTKFVLEALKDRMVPGCVVVFDELVNFDGYGGDKSELRALFEFVFENDVRFRWIGMNGVVDGPYACEHEKVAIVIDSICSFGMTASPPPERT